MDAYDESHDAMIMLNLDKDYSCPWPECKSLVSWRYKDKGLNIRACSKHLKIVADEFRRLNDKDIRDP